MNISGIQSYWIAEAGEKQKSKPTFRQIQLSLKKLVCLGYSTDELASDVGNLAKILQEGFADEIRFRTDDGILRGSGAGQILGVLNSGAVVTASKETGQAASTFLLENALSMWVRLIGSARKNAVWLIDQSVETQLYKMALAIGTGGSAVFLPGGGVSETPYMTLFGRPIIIHESCSALGTVGDVILGSFKDGYLIADKGPGDFAVSGHLRFIFDEQVFRLVYRVDGSPLLASPITPKSGGSTLSHFAVMETRS